MNRTARRWPAWLLVAALALPVLEVLVLIAVGRRIGLWPTVLALVVVAVLGGVLLRREGPRTWRSLRETLTGVRVDGAVLQAGPGAVTRELSDGALVLIGAILLLLPGFLTDVVAILALLPVTRPLLRRLLAPLVRRRTATMAARVRGRISPAVPTWRVEPGGDPGSGERPLKG